MKYRTRTLALLAGIAACTALPALGQGTGQGMGPGYGPGRGMPAFTDFDLDGNGSLTEQEFYQARANRMAERAQQGYPMRNAGKAPDFGTIDLNGDDTVDPEEFATAQAEHRQQMMQAPMAPPAR